MKKYIVAAFLFFALNLAHAQFEIGVKGGFNGSKPSTDGFGDTTISNLSLKSGSGSQFGLTFAYPINKQFAVQAEVLYSFLNASATTSLLIADVDVKVKTQYLQAPVLFKYTLRPGAALQPYFAAGPSFSYINKGRGDVTINIPFFGTTKQEVNMADSNWKDTKRLDIGITAMAGVSYQLGPGKITADFRYNHGLTDTDKTESNYKNRNWMFNLGYVYTLGKKD